MLGPVKSLLALAVLLVPTTLLAQREGFQVDPFAPPPAIDDGVSRELPRTIGHMRPSVALALHHGSDSLVLEGAGTNGEDAAAVSNQLFASLHGALGIGPRFQVSISVPIALAQGGDRPTVDGIRLEEPGDLKLADPSVGLAYWLVGSEGGVFDLGVSLSANAPIGSQDDFDSDAGFRGQGKLLASLNVGPITISVAGGARLRPERTFTPEVEVGTELVFDAGLYYRIFPELVLAAEASGSTALGESRTFDGDFTPVEALGGLRYRLESVSFALGIGGGITDAFSAPDLRGVASLGWSPVERREEAPPPPPPVDGDADGDGIRDSRDECADNPEDADRFQDQDGCPEPDNDGDGRLDGEDRCPNEAEDADQHEDDDGCPDPDNDDDGIPDAGDRCPNEPESRNGVEDEDGCPEARIEGGQVQITQRIEFEVDRDVLRPESSAILEEVATILREHAELSIRVEGHTDDTGTERHNGILSRRRAEAVVRWLVNHGIARGRLTAQGLGATRPLEQGSSEEARRRNRRVEFHIVEGGGAAAPAPAPAPNP